MQVAKANSQREENLAAYRASGKTVKQWCDQNGKHRTTVYRWLRQEAKAQAEFRETSVNEDDAKIQAKGSATIKWLPVTEKNAINKADYNTKDDSEKPIVDGTDTGEIKVQIGSFTITTPNGFRPSTFKSVCEALMDIC